MFIYLILLSFYSNLKKVKLYSIWSCFYVLVIICQRQTTEFPFKGLRKYYCIALWNKIRWLREKQWCKRCDLCETDATQHRLTAFLALWKLWLFITCIRSSITAKWVGHARNACSGHVSRCSSLCDEPLLSWRQTQFADSASLWCRTTAQQTSRRAFVIWAHQEHKFSRELRVVIPER